MFNHPTSGGTERHEAPSENDVSDQEHPAEPLRTRGASHGTDIPEGEDDRPNIIAIGVRFPDTQVTSTITVILKNHLEGPWSTWKSVPQNIKDLMWIEFQHFKWARWKHNQIYKVWKAANSNWWRASLCEERKRGQKMSKSTDPIKWKGQNPDWIPRRHWNCLIDELWSTEKWQKNPLLGGRIQ